jgi:Mce-associated membrane protein
MPRPLPRALRGAGDSAHRAAGDTAHRGPAETPASRPSPRPRPRPHPGPAAEAAAPPSREDTAPSRRRVLPGVSARAVTVLAALAVVLAIVAAVLGWQDVRARQTSAAADQALAAARTSAETLFSYDYRSIDSDLAAGRKVVTGQLAKDYADTSQVVKPQAVANRAIVDASVSAAGVVSAAPDKVVVLLYLNQATQNKNVSGTRMDYNRVRLTMVPVGGDWRIARAEPL